MDAKASYVENYMYLLLAINYLAIRGDLWKIIFWSHYYCLVCTQVFVCAPLGPWRSDNTAINSHNTIAYPSLLLADKAIKDVKTFSMKWRSRSSDR